MGGRGRGSGVADPARPEGLERRRRTAHVIRVRVRQDQTFQAADSACGQVGHDPAPARVEPAAGDARIHEDPAAGRAPYGHGVALTDVDHMDLEPIANRSQRRCDEHHRGHGGPGGSANDGPNLAEAPTGDVASGDRGREQKCGRPVQRDGGAGRRGGERWPPDRGVPAPARRDRPGRRRPRGPPCRPGGTGPGPAGPARGGGSPPGWPRCPPARPGRNATRRWAPWPAWPRCWSPGRPPASAVPLPVAGRWRPRRAGPGAGAAAPGDPATPAKESWNPGLSRAAGSRARRTRAASAIMASGRVGRCSMLAVRTRMSWRAARRAEWGAPRSSTYPRVPAAATTAAQRRPSRNTDPRSRSIPHTISPRGAPRWRAGG
jgi:hypothetical protein